MCPTKLYLIGFVYSDLFEANFSSKLRNPILILNFKFNRNSLIFFN